MPHGVAGVLVRSCSVAAVAIALAAAVLSSTPGVRAQGGAAPAADPAAVAAGEAVYNQNCADCHGAGLKAEAGRPDLRKLRPSRHDYFVTTVTKGRAPEMPAWDGIVTPEQIEQLWAYIQASRG